MLLMLHLKYSFSLLTPLIYIHFSSVLLFNYLGQLFKGILIVSHRNTHIHTDRERKLSKSIIKNFIIVRFKSRQSIYQSVFSFLAVQQKTKSITENKEMKQN